MAHSSNWTGTARDAVGDLGDAARRGYEDAAHRAREAAGEVGHRAREAYDDMADRARDAYGQAADYIDPYRRTFEDMITSNPVKAVAASLAVGVFLGWLIKRS